MSSRSCKDPVYDGKTCTGDCYILEGKIIDSVTSEGIPKVGLKLYFNTNNHPFNHRKLLVDANTNQNGEYRIIFDGTKYKDQNESFSLYAKHTDYFVNGTEPDHHIATIYTRNINFNQPVRLNYSMFWPGYIKLRLKSSTTTSVKKLSFMSTYGGFGTGLLLDLTPNLDTVIILKIASRIQTRIKWYVYPQSPFVEKRDSLTVGKNDTVDYAINLQ
ncbi:MAG: hypothetical protein H7Y07_13130 [Pyrinomonadaceae bacterium]|nr:hypothetical protein [Sphingobacteriaceae bacterium]